MQFFVGAGHGTLSAAKTTIYYFQSATNAYACIFVGMRISACVCWVNILQTYLLKLENGKSSSD